MEHLALDLDLVLHMGLELVLGVCIELFCDNGRIHWRDPRRQVTGGPMHPETTPAPRNPLRDEVQMQLLASNAMAVTLVGGLAFFFLASLSVPLG